MAKFNLRDRVQKNQIEDLAAQCGHGGTLAQLGKLREKPIGLSSGE